MLFGFNRILSFPSGAQGRHIIPGFRKDYMVKRVGVGAKRRGWRMTIHSRWDFWQAAEDMGI